MVARLRKAADPGSITHLTGLFYDCNSNRGSVLASLSAPPKQQMVPLAELRTYRQQQHKAVLVASLHKTDHG
jgi:hypothetical protein